MATEKPTANFPLDGAAGGKVRGMRVMDICAKITLRGRSEDAAFMTAAKKALGFALPDKTGKTTTSAAKANDGTGGSIGITALCLAPNEWMLWAADDACESLFGRLQESLDGIFFAAVDVSDYYAIIRLDGDNAEEMLASGCPLDLSKLQTGDCAQSHHGAAQILLHRTLAGYDIQTRISMVPHLWMRLAVVN